MLKSPQHLEQFPALFATFPDATFVVTHRDPVSVTASMVTMIAYTLAATRHRVDVEGFGRLLGRSPRNACCASCVADRDVLPAEQTIDVHFDEFMADDMGMVRRVYALAGQPLDEPAPAAMAAFMAEHPRGAIGTVEYDLPLFGLRPRGGRAPRRTSTPSGSG